MHYVSWDRTDRDAPKLLVEDGPEVLGVFTGSHANVGGEVWELTVAPEAGASAVRDGVEIVRAADPLKRGETIRAEVEGRGYTLVSETSSNWIIDNAAGEKVAQFTRANSGVRKAILEFEGETDLPATDIVALAWLSREVMESRQNVSANALIATLVLLSVVAVLVYVL